MKYFAVIETKYNGQNVKERSEYFNNPLSSQAWLTSCLRQAKELKVKVVDHYLATQAS